VLPIEKDEFFDRTASTACPNLNDAGECMIYDHRRSSAAPSAFPFATATNTSATYAS